MLNRQVILLMVDPIRASFGVSDAQMGLLKGPAFALAFLIGTILMGWIIDAMPRDGPSGLNWMQARRG